MYVTKEDVTVITIYGSYHIPKGMKLAKIGNDYAVASVADAIKCGMNEHDAKHRYLWIPEIYVEGDK
jgi:hypothetical protein